MRYWTEVDMSNIITANELDDYVCVVSAIHTLMMGPFLPTADGGISGTERID
jgi:hypothetical protein